MKGLRNSLQKLDTLENKYKPQYNPSKYTVVTLISRTYSLLALKIAFSPAVLQYLPLLFSSSWASECRQTVIIFEANIRKRAEGQSQVWLKLRVASQAPTGKPLSLPTQPRESLLPWQRSHCWKKGSMASWPLWCCFYPVMWTSHLSYLFLLKTQTWQSSHSTTQQTAPASCNPPFNTVLFSPFSWGSTAI